jgi:hypothetical protein
VKEPVFVVTDEAVPVEHRLDEGAEVSVCPPDVPQLPFTISGKSAITVQLPVIAFVVYVIPDKLPPHVPDILVIYPDEGVTVNEVVVLYATAWAVFGAIEPEPAPTDGVTV